MTAITFTNLDFTGTADDYDTDAMKLVVGQANAAITAANAVEGAVQEPLLADSTAAELKASYLSILLTRVSDVHNSYISQAGIVELQLAMDLVRVASRTQKDAALAALGA